MHIAPLYFVALLLAVAACSDEPEPTNTASINIPSSTMGDHALEAKNTALTRAAQTTLARGFDRFIISPVQVIKGANHPMGGSTAGISGSGNGGYSVSRYPRQIMLIQMLHNGEPGADSAIDARTVLSTPGAY